jgi:restriction system protein
MPLPTYEDAMLPVPQSLADGESRHRHDIVDAVAERLGVTGPEFDLMLPSGQQAVFPNRVGWAISYLTNAHVIERVARARYRITDAGRSLLAERPVRVDNSVLMRFDAFREFRQRARSNDRVREDGDDGSLRPDTETPITRLDSASPEELIESGARQIRNTLVEDLLERIAANSPQFFERLVVDVLVAMGYGGAFGEVLQSMGQSGDGGIDGIIKADKLGLDFVYVQAKRWQRSVGRPDVQQFAGSLAGERATKGVFITTSTFTNEAEAYVRGLTTRISLVDGRQLAGLMIDHGVGVTEARTVRIHRIDEDFFDYDPHRDRSVS